MLRVICVIRPHLIEGVKSAVAALGVSGMNVADVRGVGNSPERSAWQGGESPVVALPVKSRLEIVIPDDLLDSVIDAVLEHARTGEPGDGKIFVEKVSDALRVRTGERGEAAI